MDKLVISTCENCKAQIMAGPNNLWYDKSPIDPTRCEDNVTRHRPHIWYAEYGGQVVLDNRTGDYIFIVTPSGNSPYNIGDKMPEEWSIN